MCGKLSSKTESAVNWCYILAVAEKTQGRKVHESGKDREKFPRSLQFDRSYHFPCCLAGPTPINQTYFLAP